MVLMLLLSAKKAIVQALSDEVDEAELSDKMFLAVKEFDGKLRDNEGVKLGVTGDLATLTANTGKDMYLASAKISARHDFSGATNQSYKVELKMNGVIKETAIGTFSLAAAGTGTISQPYEFKNIGKKVAATEIIKLEVIAIGSDIEIEGFIECFEEPSGATPRLPALGAAGVGQSDLQFIQKQIDDGNWLESTGAINAITNKITIIPATGKTAYMHEAKIQITGHTQAALRLSTGTDLALNAVEAVLKVDTVEKDRTSQGMISKSVVQAGLGSGGQSVQYGNIGDGKFNVKGLSLVGNGTKELAIENLVDNGSAVATMSAWIKDT